jgi:YfiH family protein
MTGQTTTNSQWNDNGRTTHALTPADTPVCSDESTSPARVGFSSIWSDSGSLVWLPVPAAPSLTLLEWPEAAGLGAAIAVTSRHGGVSEDPYGSLNLGLHVGDEPDRVIANRERAARAFGVELETVIFAQQVHGVGASVVGEAERGRGTRELVDGIADTDILITSSPGTSLAILVADCVPLALLDPEAGVLAAVHAGWRGTAAQASTRALGAMAALGAVPARVVVFIGPGVHPAHYQVDQGVHEALTRAVAPHSLLPEVAQSDGPGHWRVDLMAANRQQLLLAGVTPEHILDCGVTTSDDDYFSDRASRPCGRFALLARLDGGAG